MVAKKQEKGERQKKDVGQKKRDVEEEKNKIIIYI